MERIPDIIDFNLKILFIGFNPGIRSAQTGHHFAGPSNRFWRLLYDSGLTNEKIKPNDDQTLLSYRYGITNIVSRPTRTATEITKPEYELGRIELKKKLSIYKPKYACYVGIGVYRQFAIRNDVRCGLQNLNIIHDVNDYVVSSSSGLNTIPLDQQLSFYIELKRLVEQQFN